MILKKLLFNFLLLITTITTAQMANPDVFKTENGKISVYPINHASLVLTYNNKTIFVDPVGDASTYQKFASPDLILITDTHGDHFSLKTIEKIMGENSDLVVPLQVSTQIPDELIKQTSILENRKGMHRLNFYIEAIPMYNLPESPTSKHPKGRGNGYVLDIDDKRIYISGDTEDIKEMRELMHIDIAFVCMNLRYTMNEEQAASAVLEFQPKVVYPYHYRGKDNFCDVARFKELVNNENKNIEVRLKDWYAN
ncbi:MAG TPA: MBL fold metallo-hydrolase [Flavobacteriaceae bacterium]|nr:MBL fold metallo-hydrolase [Flavobacteriaceae bacterium]